MADIRDVFWSKRVSKQIDNLPNSISLKLYAWISLVKLVGLREVRKRKGFHDEPLQGERFGQRSIRLNIAYRAFYIVKCDRTVEFIEIIEVNKHEY